MINRVRAMRVTAAAVMLAAAMTTVGCGETETRDTSTESTMARENTSMESAMARADDLFNAGDYGQAGSLFEEIATRADSDGQSETEVEASAMRARSFLALGETEQGRPWLERAARMATDDAPLGWSRYIAVKGRFEWKAGDNESATRTFRGLYDYCEKHALWSRAVDAANMVSITGDENERFAWALKGIEMAKAGGMTEWLGPLWNNLGWNYHDAGRYEEAYDALVKAREYHYMKEAELPRLIADYSVAHIKMKQGKATEAQSEMLAVLEWASRLDAGGNKEAEEWMGLSRWDLGEMTLERGDRAAGIAMLEKALMEIERSGMPNWDPDQWRKKQDRVAEAKQ